MKRFVFQVWTQHFENGDYTMVGRGWDTASSEQELRSRWETDWRFLRIERPRP